MEQIKILLVEESNIAATAISTMLKEKGCQVDIVDNGITALKKYKTESYNLILINTCLGKGKSIEITRQIREHEIVLPCRKIIPIIGIFSDPWSGEDETPPYQKYLLAGMTDVFFQPLTMLLINEILKKYMY